MKYEIKELSLEDGIEIYEMLQKQPADEKDFLTQHVVYLMRIIKLG